MLGVSVRQAIVQMRKLGLREVNQFEKVTELAGLGFEQGLISIQQGRCRNAEHTWRWQGPTLSIGAASQAEPCRPRAQELAGLVAPELGLELKVAGTTAH